MSIRKKKQVIKSMDKCQEFLRNAKLQAMTAQVRDDRDDDTVSAEIDALIIDLEAPLQRCQSIGEEVEVMRDAEEKAEAKEKGK